MPDGIEYLPTSWYDLCVEVRPSSIQGGGMFARAPVQPGEAVAIVGGTPMTGAEFAAYLKGVERWNAHQIGEDMHLVDLIQTPDVVDGSLNHSCDSNLWMGDEVTIIARRPIAAGEELTLDYALTTTQPDWALDQPCQCGSPLCRGMVTGNDWRLPSVQARYAGHFVPYINERIRRLQEME
ncbi:MAG TPA: SET domain-containing protein [Ktedonobacterales bacterium]|jgi:hypothetical protein